MEESMILMTRRLTIFGSRWVDGRMNGLGKDGASLIMAPDILGLDIFHDEEALSLS